MKAIFQSICYRSNRLMPILLALCISVSAQTFNLTGTVVDSATSQGIANAFLKIVEIPKCTTKTNANGSFTLNYTSGITLRPISSSQYDAKEITLKGNALFITKVKPSTQILVEVYNCNGSRTRYFQMSSGSDKTIACSDLWQTPGWYSIKVRMEGKDYSVSGIGMNNSFFPDMEKDKASFLSGNEQIGGLAKGLANYTLNVSASGYVVKQTTITITTGSVGTIKLSKPPKVNTGTGTNYQPSYVTVTGGGAMPDIANGYTCNCDGTGATDASACLQTAANTANTQKKPLLIPYTTGFYKIIRAITIYGSVIGTGGMPTIKQTTPGGQVNYSGLRLAANMTGWIYNLHIVGTYNGSNASSEYAHNINLGGVNGVTIRGCLLENAMGDNIADHDEQWGAVARNVLIDNNTLVNPRRCNISFVCISDKWAIMNNDMNYSARYVDPIDLEPCQELSYITNIEVAYNKITSPGAAASFYGKIMDVDSYFDHTPGQNIYGHHNYGTWGVPFGGTSAYWTNVVFSKNVQGNSVPQ